MPSSVRRLGRFCGSQTPPRNRRTATGRPSSLGQTGEPPGFHPHTAHRNGANPTAAPDQARRRPHRPPAVWCRDSVLPVDSVAAPRVDTFSCRARSSVASACRRDKRLHSREESLSPSTRLTATIDWYTGSFSDRLLGSLFEFQAAFFTVAPKQA